MQDKFYDIENQEIEEEDNSSCTISTPFSPSDIRLTTPPMNLGDIIDMIQYGYIDFGAEYQREENLWSDEQQSRLIESILLGLRLPAFYFEEVSKKKWRIIDGLQRCCSIRNFCVDQTLKLNGLEFLKDMFDENTRYSNLSFHIKRDIRMLPVTVNLLAAGTPDDVKYILFKRLNTGGIRLTPQEIRNAVYLGTPIDIVRSMSNSEEFLHTTGGKIPTRRKQSMDFVSRFVAFYLVDYSNYTEPDLDYFINQVMGEIKAGVYDSQLIKMQEDFDKAMRLAREIFGDEAFRKRKWENASKSPLNKALFEVISVTFAKLKSKDLQKLLRRKEDLKERLMMELQKNRSFDNSFSGGTATITSVKTRFAMFNHLIQEVLC